MNKSTTHHLKHIILYILASSVVWADVTVKDVTVKPRWPWNGLVNITYSIQCDEKDDEGNPKDVYVKFSGIDNVRNQKIAMKTLTGDGAKDSVKHGGPYTVTWNAGKDCPSMDSAAVSVKIDALVGLGTYMVVDLSGGPNAASYPVRYTNNPPDLDDDTCRTTELWLRQIPAGTFMMGSPDDEIGHCDDESPQHQVTISHLFYIGVFECTQKQWELVMGNKPSSFEGDCRPVENISFNDIRGDSTTGGGGWPTYGHVMDANSFMGILGKKTGKVFDLPTEAEWEYACRAGTTTGLNSGKNLSISGYDYDAALAEVGRYYANQYDGKGGYSSKHTKVGSYMPNVWGLYDMHGNVYEWCLDWYERYYYKNEAVIDPKGPETGTEHVSRSGGWCYGSRNCRSAYRGHNDNSPSLREDMTGFRIVCLPYE